MDVTKKGALVAIIKLVADAAKDTVAALQPGQPILSKLLSYENLVTDIEALTPQLGDVKAELAGLLPADYVDLAATLVTDLAFTNPKATAIVQASVDLLAELAGPVLYKTQALFAAVKA